MMDLANPPGVRTLTSEESARLKRDYPDIPSSPEQCITCKGVGKFLWWDDPESSERVAVGYVCPCNEQWILHRYLLSAGIGLSYQQLSWADMQWTEPDAKEIVLKYLDERDTYVRNGYGLILHGERGSGKTALATLLLKALLANGHNGCFTTFNEMVNIFASGWTSEADKDWFHRRIKNAGVLVIDDPGKEMKGRDLPPALLDEVIRHRVSDLRPTIITTNHTLAEFQADYGVYVMSLLAERATTYEFKGTDARPQYNNRTKDEMAMGLHRPVVIW